jgi:hypothetical protein
MRREPVVVAIALLLPACQSRSDQQAASQQAASSRTPQASTTQGAPSPATATTAPVTPAPNAPPRPGPPPLPDPLPGKRTDLTAKIGGAWRAVIADIDGDGKQELVVVDSQQLRVLDAAGREKAATPISGGVHRLVAADLDGDRKGELYVGWGQTREHMDTKARVSVFRLASGKLAEDPVLEIETTRNEIVEIVPMPDTKGLLVAYFDSKYMVTSKLVTLVGKAFSADKLAQLRTATSYARGDVDGDGKPDIVVGRVYGDDKGIDGDAFVLGLDGTRTPIPSTRGLRSIAVADVYGDGRNEVVMSDGWHQNYGQHARGLLTIARHKPEGFTTELVEDTPGQFELMRILPATIDGKPAIVTLGSHYVRVFWRAGERWQGLTIAGAARDIAVGDLDGQPGDEVVVIGDKSELVNLRGALQ